MRHGKSSLEMASVLEDAMNGDSKKHEWAPEVYEMGLQSTAKESIAQSGDR